MPCPRSPSPAPLDVENGGYTLLTALFYNPDPHNLSLSIPHAVVGVILVMEARAAPAGFGNNDLIPVLGKAWFAIFCLLTAAGDF